MALLVRVTGRDGAHVLPAPSDQSEREEISRFLDRHGQYALIWIRLASGEYVRYDQIVSIRITE